MKIRIFDHIEYNIDHPAQQISSIVESFIKPLEKGFCLYREPDFRTEGREVPTFTIVSPSLGLVFIKAYRYTDEDQLVIGERNWQINGQPQRSEYYRFRNYVHKIKARVDDPLIEFTNELVPRTVYFFPNIHKQNTRDALREKLKEQETVFFVDDSPFNISNLDSSLSIKDFELLVSIIQNSNILNKSSSYIVEEPAKNMSEVIELHNKKIAQFDSEQMAASLTITDKCERIRGLAGSGKTVLLAMKAAKLHYKYPDKKIAFVFFTKSLYNQANSLIRKYYNQIADDEPNWENLKVLHSWGGKTTGEGFYSYICKAHEISPRPFNRSEADVFVDNCKELLDLSLKEIFDFILIDEAQDFPLVFFRLAYKVARNPKKIVIAYDELQTTSNVKIPAFEELFGNTNGVANVKLAPEFDYTLKKSYRNTLDTLITAFSFGFGFYDELTQIIQDETTWDALGFKTNSSFTTGSTIVVTRPVENSPNSLPSNWKKQSPVEMKVLEKSEDEIDFIAHKIYSFIIDEKVKPTDILVIDIAMNRTKSLNSLQFKLASMNISSYLPGVMADARHFFEEGSVTLSTPRNAKGNEVPIVFVMGCEDIYQKTNMFEKRVARNFMFISITRSKGWVILTAAGRVKGRFSGEFRKIAGQIPNMVFVYPDEENRKLMAKIDFMYDNPKAKEVDTSLATLRNLLEKGDSAVVKQLLELDPNLKSALLDLLEK